MAIKSDPPVPRPAILTVRRLLYSNGFLPPFSSAEFCSAYQSLSVHRLPLHRLDAHSCRRLRHRRFRQRHRLAEAARCNDNGNHHRNQQCRPREDYYHLFYHCMYHIVCVAALIFVGQDSRTSVTLCTACRPNRTSISLRCSSFRY